MAIASIPQRRCKSCGNEYPLTSEFWYKDKKAKYCLGYSCRDCKKEKARQRAIEKRDIVLEEKRRYYRNNKGRAHDYYMENRDRILEAKRADRKANPEKYAERERRRLERNYDEEVARWASYRARHPEVIKRNNDKWKSENSDKVKEYSAQYYLDNQEAIKAKSRRLYRENIDHYLTLAKRSTAERRALQAQAPGKHTTKDLHELFECQDGRCGYCGVPLHFNIKNDVHLDHMTPISRGGNNDPDNLCYSCRECNLSKRDKMPEEWQAWRGW